MPRSPLLLWALLCAGLSLSACQYTDCDQAAFALRNCWNQIADCTQVSQTCSLRGASCSTDDDCPMDSENWSCVGGTCVTTQPASTLCLAYKNGDPTAGGGLTTNDSASDRPDCDGSYLTLADSILSCTMSQGCQVDTDCPSGSACINYYCNAITPATGCVCPGGPSLCK